MNLPHIKLHSQFLMWPSNNNEIRQQKTHTNQTNI